MPTARDSKQAGLNRRAFLKTTSLIGFGGLLSTPTRILMAAESVNMPFSNGQRSLVTFPQKRPLILLTTRPPQLETPFSVFNEGLLTPNDAFFVRYHLSQVPTSIDPASFRLAVSGNVNSPLKLSLEELK